MPPIRQQPLDEAFLAHLLQQQQQQQGNDTIDNNNNSILNTNIDSESLSLVLKRLDSSSHAFQQELMQQVHTYFDEFSTSYNTSQKLYSDIFQLVKQTSAKQDQVAHTQSTVADTIDGYQDALAASQSNKTKMDLLEKLQHMLQIIELVHQELKQCSYVKAVQHVLELQSILTTWQGQQAQQRVLDMMGDRIGHLKQTLIQQLEQEVHAGLQYNMGSMRILTRPFHEKQVLECLDQLGLLAETMMGVQRQVFKHILNPYFENKSQRHHLQVDHVTVDQLGTGGVLQVIPVRKEEGEEEEEEEEEEEKRDPIQMMQQMDTILSFFYKYMFDSKKNDMNLLFGNLLLPDLMDKMILKGISPCIPSSKETLDLFNTIIHHVSSFEQQVATYGFIPSSSTETVLGQYVNQIDTHYAKNRRNKILQQGRKVMLRRLYDAEMTQQQQEGHTYHYQITQTPQILAVLVGDTLIEAMDLLTSQHPISAFTLVEGIQDLLDMYRAMMPSFHRPQYLSGPSQSLIFRNDCLWLAHQLTTHIASMPEMKQFVQLEKVLQVGATRLMELGKAWHELTMMHRVEMIQHVLDGLDGFSGMLGSNGDTSLFQHDCDVAISQVLALVQSFASDIRGVVDDTLFLDMMGRIVETCVDRLIRDIEELVDIGAEESHVIAVTLNSFAQLAIPGEDKAAAFGEQASDAFVSDLVPSWHKFWLLKDILEMNMKEIMQVYRKGDLHMFEKDELVGLLCALFADTELRESNIQEIKLLNASGERFLRNQVEIGDEQVGHIVPVSHQARQEEEEQQQQQGSTTFGASGASQFTTMPLKTTASALEYTLDEDMLEEEAETGWGDDDLFAGVVEIAAANDSVTPPPPLDTITANAIHGATLEKPYAISSSSSLLEPKSLGDFTMEQEGEGEGEGGGWGDADQDIFMENDDEDYQNDQQQEEHDNKKKNLLLNDETINAKTTTHGTSDEMNEPHYNEEPGKNKNGGPNPSDQELNNTAPSANSTTATTTNMTQKRSGSSTLDFKAIDHEIDQELEGQEGWGWDDDEDLFKDQAQDELR